MTPRSRQTVFGPLWPKGPAGRLAGGPGYPSGQTQQTRSPASLAKLVTGPARSSDLMPPTDASLPGPSATRTAAGGTSPPSPPTSGRTPRRPRRRRSAGCCRGPPTRTWRSTTSNASSPSRPPATTSRRCSTPAAAASSRPATARHRRSSSPTRSPPTPSSSTSSARPPRRNPSTAELTAQLAGRGRRRRRRRRPCCGRSAASATGTRSASASTTSSATGRSKRSPATLARVADAAIEVALQHALRSVGEPVRRRRSRPTASRPAVAVLAFGKLGGEELNYSSDIDLMFVYDDDGETAGRRTRRRRTPSSSPASSREVVRLLSRAHRPRAGVPRRPAAAARGAPRPARPVAGQHPELLRHDGPHVGAAGAHQAAARRRRRRARRASSSRPIEPFVYRKYFSFAEINEIKALKRQIEQQGRPRPGADDREVKTGRGGIRDIEFTVQFLQLLNGGDLPAVRQRNTLLALEALEIAGCLTDQEYVHPRRRLPLPPQDRAPAATAVRPADAPLPDRAGRAAEAGAADGLRGARRRARSASPRSTVTRRPALTRPARRARAPRSARPLDESAAAAARHPRPARRPARPVPQGLPRQDRARPDHPRPPAAPDVRRTPTGRPSRRPT